MKIPLVWSHANGLDNQAVPKYLYGDPDVLNNIYAALHWDEDEIIGQDSPNRCIQYDDKTKQTAAARGLEPVCCKKQQKKFMTSYWFVQ